MLDGTLHIREGDTEHELSTGDCLEFGPPSPRTFSADAPCRYLVALTRRRAEPGAGARPV